MKKYIFIILSILYLNGFGQVDTLFTQANRYYKNGKYQEAITQYEKIRQKGVHSPELYFNLGNAYYKLNRIAPSIYYYEKALKLNPGDEDIIYNLGLANQMKLDQIEQVPENIFVRFRKAVAGWFTTDTWAVMSIIWAFAGLLAFLSFLFLQKPSYKRMSFTAMFIALFLFVFFLYFSFYSQRLDQTKYAVIFASQTDLRNEPNLTADKVITLHEGSKVKLEKTDDNWAYVKLPDGKKAWVLRDDIKVIE